MGSRESVRHTEHAETGEKVEVNKVRKVVNNARNAWKEAREARERADAADREVEELLQGREVIIIDGFTNGQIASGTVVESHELLQDQRARVAYVSYHYNREYRIHEDTLRVQTPDDRVLQLSVNGTEIRLVDETEQDNS